MVVACDKLKGKSEDTSTPITTTSPVPTPPTTTTTEGSVTKTVVGKTTTLSGTLRGVNDSNKVSIFLNDNAVSVIFTYPSGSDFGVKVLGMSDNELGDFRLNEGDTIDLSGGGKFTLIVYSRGGSGPWTATYTED